MAAEQARRENVTDERKIEVEKDRVPKMTTHFESLVEKTRQGPSLEEISKSRGTAQQNSMEAIRAAEERYEKAKEKGGSAAEKAKESESLQPKAKTY